MKLIRGLHNIPEGVFADGSALTMGNFDGIHLGHRALIANVIKKAKKLHIPSVVLLFEPQPSEFFQKEHAAPRLMRLREKLGALKGLGLDYVLVQRFDQRMANMSAQAFFDEILQGKCNVKAMVSGGDFHFGRNRLGNVKFLEAQDLDLEVVDDILLHGGKISSSRVRSLLAKGDFSLSAELLNKSYSMEGKVVRGDQRGRTLGFPTINLLLHRKKSPIEGVFVVEVKGLKDKILQGAANLGFRPTFGCETLLLEVHLLNFNEMVYGERVEVVFLKKIRSEKKFDSADELVEMMEQDTQFARQYFNLN